MWQILSYEINNPCNFWVFLSKKTSQHEVYGEDSSIKITKRSAARQNYQRYSFILKSIAFFVKLQTDSNVTSESP